ncbi:hypothetical protein ACFYOV_04420 [Streptomyces sp. NPDC005931]|uniref:hypothetical protein n=1 Tax=Streptomyces sp. NPDC005931 TaxID=3364737 RepID=UPI0036CA10FB
MPPSRRSRTVRRAAAVALVLAAAVGCGDTGGLRSAGATPTAISPARLWPEMPPASSPAFDLGEVDTEVVEGVAVPGDDIRAVDPVAIVRAEITAHPDDYTGDRAPYRATGPRLADCAEGGSSEGGSAEGASAEDGSDEGPSAEDGSDEGPRAGDGSGERAGCPLLEPYYRDLTGDGRDDMTLGFRLFPGDLTAVRVYTVDRHRLVKVMAYDDAVSGVELAGRSVIIRSPSEVAGYEYRLQWTWDPQQRAMLLTHDEMLRTAHEKPVHPKPVPSEPTRSKPAPSNPEQSNPAAPELTPSGQPPASPLPPAFASSPSAGAP